MPTFTPRQTQFLQQLSQSKNRLLDAIEGIDDEIICHEPILGDWTIKDLLGHLVSWNQEFRRNIELILQGEQPAHTQQINGEHDFDGWNQNIIAKKRDWPLERIMADLHDDINIAADLIRTLKPEDFRQRGVTSWKSSALDNPDGPSQEDTDTVETLVTFHWRHINQHAQQIESWRDQDHNLSDVNG